MISAVDFFYGVGSLNVDPRMGVSREVGPGDGIWRRWIWFGR